MADLHGEKFSEIFKLYKDLFVKFPWTELFVYDLQKFLLSSIFSWAETVSEVDTSTPYIEQCTSLFLQEIEKAVDGIKLITNAVYENQLDIAKKYFNNLELLQKKSNVQIPTVTNESETITIRNYQRCLKSKIENFEKNIDFQKQIESYKSKLEEMWDICHCDSNVKNDFPIIYTTNYNEETKLLFEKELDRWQKYYKKNKIILKNLDEYKSIIEKISEIELNIDYKNRGAKLLENARQLDLSKKRIQKLSDTLMHLAQAYYQKNGFHFLSFGETIETILQKSSHKEKLQQVKFFSTKPSPNKNVTPVVKRQVKKVTPCKSTTKTPIIEKKVNLNNNNSQEKSANKSYQLPKFKLNKTNVTSVKKKYIWKPSRASFSLQNLDDSSFTSEYSDFEKDVKVQPRSSSFTK